MHDEANVMKELDLSMPKDSPQVYSTCQVYKYSFMQAPSQL